MKTIQEKQTDNPTAAEAAPRIPWEERPSGSDSVLWRYSANPVIGWNPLKAGARAYNSAVLPYGKGFIGVFRVDHHNGMPALHLGRSDNALDWEIEEEVIQFVDEAGNPAPVGAYAYDPRLLRMEDAFYISWCAEFPDTMAPTIGLARTEDFRTFTRLENAYLPFNRNGVLFPRKIGGEYVMLNRPSDNGHTPFGDIFLSHSPDLCFWGKHRLVMKAGASGWWEGTKIGPGPVPLETSEGWLILYHAVLNTCNGFVYSIGSALLDLDEPSRVLARSNRALLSPEKSYETTGFTPNVAFPCATLHEPETGRLAIYYGAADTFTAVAFGRVPEIIEWTKANSGL
jgi:beta-1,4-mannooligosaccharide/beta-1,4-mannosyl-N-acetylglucosamine phosphorylase